MAPPRRHRKTTDCASLDVRQLFKSPRLKAGKPLVLQNRLAIVPGRDDVSLIFQLPGREEPSVQVIGLARIPGPRGGERRLFLCPECMRQTTILYWPPGGTGYACRLCEDLRYPSQSMGKLDRTLARLHKIERRLGWPLGIYSRVHPRPPGMHLRTYRRLCAQQLEVAAEAARLSSRALAKTMERYYPDCELPQPPAG